MNKRLKSGVFARIGTIAVAYALASGASASLTGCDASDGSDIEEIGELGFKLEVAPGVTLNSVSYTITGNGFEKSGSIDVSDSPSVSGTVGGIPSGKGYSIELTATSPEEDTGFKGSAKFDVSAGKTTPVSIRLRGTQESGHGSVSVTGTVNVAPVVDELTVAPQTAYVGSSVTLTAVGRDADDAPSPLTYYWSTSEGVIDDPLAPNASLTSSSPGTATVKLTISDGDSTATATAEITFVAREPGGGSGTSPEHPNVLLIIADDLGAESVSLYPELVGDSGAVPTPNIEALAEKGLVFDNAWVSPACSMTRGTIISGKYAHRTGVTYVGGVLPTDTVSVFDRLTAESPSYSHALFGKYHVGGGNDASYDPLPGDPYPEAVAVLQHARDLGITTYRGLLAGGIYDYFNWTTYDINAAPYANTTYATTAITDFAIEYIGKHEATRPNEPWFVYQAYNAPHSPFQVPPSDLHSVDLGGAKPGEVLNTLPNYKAMIQSLDTSIGRLLDEVDLEDTTVIFIGDNGTPGNKKDSGAGVRGSKGSVYEGGVRVPLVVAGAGVTRRGRENALVNSSDLYATVLSLAGVPVSHVENSYSIEPLFSDEAASSGRTHSFSESAGARRDPSSTAQRYAIRDSRYKLVSNDKVRELYDLIADPLETTNLYASAAHTAVRAALEAEIEAIATNAPEGYFP